MSDMRTSIVQVQDPIGAEKKLICSSEKSSVGSTEKVCLKFQLRKLDHIWQKET